VTVVGGTVVVTEVAEVVELGDDGGVVMVVLVVAAAVDGATVVSADPPPEQAPTVSAMRPIHTARDLVIVPLPAGSAGF